MTRVAKKISKKPAARAAQSNKVDYYPNRMTLAISALGGAILVLLAVIVAVNQ